MKKNMFMLTSLLVSGSLTQTTNPETFMQAIAPWSSEDQAKQEQYMKVMAQFEKLGKQASANDYLNDLLIRNPYTSPEVKAIAQQLLPVKGRDALIIELARMLTNQSSSVLAQTYKDIAGIIINKKFSDPIQEQLFDLALQNTMSLFALASDRLVYLGYNYTNPTQALTEINIELAQELTKFSNKVNQTPLIAQAIAAQTAATEAREHLYQDQVDKILHSSNPEIQAIGKMFSQKDSQRYLWARLLSPLLLNEDASKQAIGIYLGKLVLQGQYTINTAGIVLQAFVDNNSKAPAYLERLKAALGNDKELSALDREVFNALHTRHR